MRRPIRSAMAIVLAAAGMAKTTAAPGDWQDYIGFTLSERLRGEFVDWFRPPAGTAAPGRRALRLLREPGGWIRALA